MKVKDLHSFRMVIQQLAVEPVYRIVVYGDKVKPKHADFRGEQTLLQALRSALPSFDISGLSLDPLHGDQGSIVFAGLVELNNRQLGLLGLI